MRPIEAALAFCSGLRCSMSADFEAEFFRLTDDAIRLSTRALTFIGPTVMRSGCENHINKLEGLCIASENAQNMWGALEAFVVRQPAPSEDEEIADLLLDLGGTKPLNHFSVTQRLSHSILEKAIADESHSSNDRSSNR